MHESPTVESLAAELAALRAELVEVKGHKRKHRRHAALTICLGVIVCLGATAAWSAGTCNNLIPVCFVPNTAALASDVNTNFDQIEKWIEAKVGAVDATNLHNVRVQGGATSNVAAASGRPLFVSGGLSDGRTSTAGCVEFRKDDLSQGIGIGYDTIYAASSSGQNLNLKAGIGGINLLNTTNVTGDLNASGNSTLAGNLTVQANTWGVGPNLSTYASMVPANTDIPLRCSNGQYMCGFHILHGSGVQWYENSFAIDCCGL
jgi:hypothetical protein